MSHDRRISYQWRFFFPLVILLWLLLLGLAGWQYYRERQYRQYFVSNQLQFINHRIVEFIDNGEKRSLDQFLSFLDEYYDRLELFDNIRVTLYDRDMNVIENVGLPIALDTEDSERVLHDVVSRNEKIIAKGTRDKIVDREFYFLGQRTANGSTVLTALPVDDNLVRYLSGNTSEVWLLIFVIALIMTAVCFIATHYLGRNIRILRDFAVRSAEDPQFMPGSDFPHDELGDIARRIVQMYNDRAAARKRTEEEHAMALRSIEEKVRQKRQLTNDINHELKTPIGVIKGYLDTIANTPDMDEETRNRFITKALEHTNRLVSLIADVSAITRLDENPNSLSTEVLDFYEVVRVFADDVRESGILGDFKFDIDIPEGVSINGNRNMIVGTLLNLTKNAVSYSRGTRCGIEYRGADDRFYYFEYYDDGSGVPDEALEHLFDRFYRIDTGRSRQTGGTGLGLAIVYNTIKAHGGNISVENRHGGGLGFVFSLPRWV